MKTLRFLAGLVLKHMLAGFGFLTILSLGGPSFGYFMMMFPAVGFFGVLWGLIAVRDFLKIVSLFRGDAEAFALVPSHPWQGWRLGCVVPLVLVLGFLTLDAVGGRRPGSKPDRGRRHIVVVADISKVLDAENTFAEASGGSFAPLHCLASPSECLPGRANGEPFLDEALASAVVSGFPEIQAESLRVFRRERELKELLEKETDSDRRRELEQELATLSEQAEKLYDAGTEAEPSARSGYVRTFYPGPPSNPETSTDVARRFTSFAYVALPASSLHGPSFCGDSTGRICSTTERLLPEVTEGVCPTSCSGPAWTSDATWSLVWIPALFAVPLFFLSLVSVLAGWIGGRPLP